MRIGSITLLGVPLLVMGACAQPPKVDVEAERASLLAADKAWSQMVSDMDKVTSVLADDAVFLGEGMPKITGRAAISATRSGRTRSVQTMPREPGSRPRGST